MPVSVRALMLRLREPIGFTAATNVAISAIGVLTGVIAARLLGPVGRGELAAIQLWPSIIGTIATLGLPDALVYFSARKPNQAGSYLGSAFALAIMIAIPFAAMGWIAMPLLLSTQTPPIVEAARIYLAIVFIYVFCGLPFHPLRGRSDFLTWNLLRIAPQIGWLVLLVAEWITGTSDAQFLAMTYLVILAGLSVPITAVVRSRIGRFGPIDTATWRPMLRFGIPSAASSLPQLLNLRLDQMLIATTLTARDLGLYVTAVAWGSAIQPLVGAIGTVLFPRVASADHADQGPRLVHGTRAAVSAALVLSVLIAVATPTVLPLVFGIAFRSIVPIALILVAAGAVWSFNGTLEEGLRGAGRPRAVLMAEGAGIALTVPVLIILVPSLGLAGAALASLLGYSVVAAVLLANASKASGLPWIQFVTPRLPKGLFPPATEPSAPLPEDHDPVQRVENPLP